MLHETKVGVVVACSFLGLVGTVVAMKYHGDPLAAASMESAGVVDNSFLTEPIPLPPAQEASPNPVPPSKGGAGLENLGNGHGIQLVGTGDLKPPGAGSANPPAPAPVDQATERRTVPPQVGEQGPGMAPAPPGELVGPPVPPDLAAAPAAPETHEAPSTGGAAAQPGGTTAQPHPDGSLIMPAPDAAIGRDNPPPPTAPENHSTVTGSPAPGPGAPPVAPIPATNETPAPTNPTTRPLATLGAPDATAAHGTNPPIPGQQPPSGQGGHGLADHHPSTPGTGALAAGGPVPGAGTPIGMGSPHPSGGPTAVVSPPIPVQNPATSAPPLVPRVVSFDEETYPCKPGDSFRTIAQQYYHNDKYERALLMFNRNHPLASDSIRTDPPTLQPGMMVHLPQVKELESRYPTLIPDLAPLPQAAVAAPPPAAQRYQVRTPTGEMMRDIAGRSLGNPERWVDIYRMNPNLDPARPLPAGTVLQMPADAKP